MTIMKHTSMKDIEGHREEESEATAKAYYYMLSAAQQPLHRHTKVFQLDAIARLMAVKS